MRASSSRALAFALACAPTLVGSALAAEASYEAMYTGQFTKQEARPLGSKDTLLIVEVAQGTNKSTGKDKFMDGAQILWSETVNLNKGSGPQRGLISLVDDTGSATSEYAGEITTTMKDGQQLTTGKGTWKFVSGTGAYSGGSGSGTYDLTMTSQTEFKGTWKGNVTLPKK